MTLSDQRVVVVGGTSGMGLATVRAAAAQGAEVIAAGRRSVAGRDRIDGVVQAEVDVTDETSVRALFDGLGTLDHLLVSASPGSGPVPGAGPNGGAYVHRRQAPRELDLRSLRRAAYGRRRSITFVTGVAVVRPPGNAAMVTAAFAAIEALSRALALELGPLRVNTIRPGYTDSEMWSGLSHGERDDLRRRVADALPVGRMGTPEDIAHAAVFLMTSRQTTGAVLEVSGGESLVDRLR